MGTDELRTEMEKLAAQREALEALCRSLDLDPLTARVPELAGKPVGHLSSRQAAAE